MRSLPKMEGQSEEVLVIIFGFLSTVDLSTVSCVNRRFQRIAMDSRLHRSVSFKSCWNIPGKKISTHMKRHKASLECLDLEDCYWIKTPDLRSSLLACRNLKWLNILGCNVTPNTVIQTLENNPDLTELRWSIRKNGNLEFSRFKALLENFQQLKSLHLRVNSLYRVLEQSLSEFAEQHLYEFWCKFHPINILDNSDELYVQKKHALPGEQPHLRSYVNNFSHFLNVDHVKLDLINYGEENVRDVTSIIVTNNSLRYLRLSASTGPRAHTWVTSDVLECIAMKCPNLETLNLRGSWNCLSPIDGMKTVSNECQNLSHLNLARIHCHAESNELLLALSNLRNLSSLALTACAVASTREPDASGFTSIGCDAGFNPSGGFSKGKGRLSHEKVGTSIHGNISGSSTACSDFSKDVSHKTTEASEDPFELLTKCCQNVWEFELISGEFSSFGNEVASQREKDCPILSSAPLAYIANWKLLKRLTLAGLIVRGSAQFLVTIMQGCPDLEHLSLAHLNQLKHSGGVSSLNKALCCAHNLKEFRLEQPHFNISKQFLSSLGNAIKLERLCLIARHGTFVQLYAVALFKKCPQLICFQALCDVTYKVGWLFNKSITARFGKNRPALFVCLVPYRTENLGSGRFGDFPDSIPWVHLHDLTVFHSNVATKYH